MTDVGKLTIPPGEQTPMDTIREAACIASASVVSAKVNDVLHANCDNYAVAISTLEISMAYVLLKTEEQFAAEMGRAMEPADWEHLMGVCSRRTCAHIAETVRRREQAAKEVRDELERGRSEIRRRRGGDWHGNV